MRKLPILVSFTCGLLCALVAATALRRAATDRLVLAAAPPGRYDAAEPTPEEVIHLALDARALEGEVLCTELAMQVGRMDEASARQRLDQIEAEALSRRQAVLGAARAATLERADDERIRVMLEGRPSQSAASVAAEAADRRTRREAWLARSGHLAPGG